MSFRLFAGAITAATLLAAPLRAQSKGKVLTPPRPADSTRARPTAPNAAPGAEVPRPSVEIAMSPVLDSIREVVFRNLLERDRAGISTLASAFCLGLSNDDFKKPASPSNRVDPPEYMVKRLYTPRTPARGASGCTFGTAPASDSRASGRPLLYTVGAIQLLSPGRAEVAAGYLYDGMSSGGYAFTVERVDDVWTVRQWRMEWTGKGQ